MVLAQSRDRSSYTFRRCAVDLGVWWIDSSSSGLVETSWPLRGALMSELPLERVDCLIAVILYCWWESVFVFEEQSCEKL